MFYAGRAAMSEKQTKIGIILYRIGSRAYFYLPFFTIYLHYLGYRIFEISCIMAVYGLASFLYSLLPSSDRVVNRTSYRKALLFSELLKLVGLLFLFIGTNAFVLAIGQFLLGISFAIPEGSDSKIIYSYIKKSGFQEKTNGYMFLSLLLSGLIGSILFQINPRFPFLFSIAAALLTMLHCIVFLPENRDKKQDNISYDEIKNFRELPIEVKKVIASYAVGRGLSLAFFTGFLPYYFGIELKLPAYIFILLLSGYTLSGNLSANGIGRLKDKDKVKFGFILFHSSILAVPILFLFKNIAAIIIGTILLGTAVGISRPICFVQIKEMEQFTFLVGKMEKMYAVVNFFTLIIGGCLYERFSLYGILIWMLCIWGIYMIYYFYCSNCIKPMKIDRKNLRL